MKINFLHFFSLFAGLILALTLVISEPSKAESTEATTIVESFHDVLLNTMKSAKEYGIQGRYKVLEPAIISAFDLQTTVRVAAGRTWRKASSSEKSMLTNAFKHWSISNYASPDGPPRIKVKNTLQDLKSIGPIRALPNASVSQKLLELIFDRMNPHIWFRILPQDSNKCDDFAFSVGQSWDLIQPLLLHLGYLLQVGNQIKLNVDKLSNLQHANLGKHKLHMPNTHLKGEAKHYFICIGKPHFSWPTKQLKAINCGAFASTSI